MTTSTRPRGLSDLNPDLLRGEQGLLASVADWARRHLGGMHSAALCEALTEAYRERDRAKDRAASLDAELLKEQERIQEAMRLRERAAESATDLRAALDQERMAARSAAEIIEMQKRRIEELEAGDVPWTGSTGPLEPAQQGWADALAKVTRERDAARQDRDAARAEVQALQEMEQAAEAELACLRDLTTPRVGAAEAPEKYLIWCTRERMWFGQQGFRPGPSDRWLPQPPPPDEEWQESGPGKVPEVGPYAWPLPCPGCGGVAHAGCAPCSFCDGKGYILRIGPRRGR